MSGQQVTDGEGGLAALPAGTPVLQMRGISKRYGAVEALTDVDFEVYPGEERRARRRQRRRQVDPRSCA